jgi:hypothetical protein
VPVFQCHPNKFRLPVSRRQVKRQSRRRTNLSPVLWNPGIVGCMRTLVGGSQCCLGPSSGSELGHTKVRWSSLTMQAGLFVALDVFCSVDCFDMPALGHRTAGQSRNISGLPD